MGSKTPLVSIVVLNHNGRGFVEKCIKSILNTSYRMFEIILIDAASTDGSPELVQELFGSVPNLKIIRNEKDLGAAECRNQGAREARGKYVAFIDNDILVDFEWLKPMINVMEHGRQIGVAQPIRVETDSSLLQGYVADHFSFVHSIQAPYKSSNMHTVFAVSASAMLVKKEIFDKIGMFDPHFFIAGEDIDLCWRAWLSRSRVVCITASKVYHMRKGRYKPFRERVFFSIRNRISMLIKNYELYNILRYLPPFLLMVLLGVAYFAVKKRVDVVKSIVNAVASSMIGFSYIWRQHLKVQNIRRVSDREIENLFVRSRLEILSVNRAP